MKLIQIGEVRQKTVFDLVMEMAACQFAEIELLKTTARKQGTDPACESSLRLLTPELTA